MPATKPSNKIPPKPQQQNFNAGNIPVLGFFWDQAAGTWKSTANLYNFANNPFGAFRVSGSPSTGGPTNTAPDPGSTQSNTQTQTPSPLSSLSPTDIKTFIIVGAILLVLVIVKR